MSDPLHTLLDELSGDVKRARLSDPSAVRRRGEQRTHRKIAGAAVVGGVAVIAVALLGSGPLRSLADQTSPPAASQAPSVSASPPASPSASPSASASTSTSPAEADWRLPLAKLPHLRDGAWQIVSNQPDSNLSPCVIAGGAVATPLYPPRWFATKANPAAGDEQATFRAFDQGSSQAAHELLQQAQSQAKSCWRSTNTVTKVTGGDEAVFLYGGRDVGLRDAVSIQGIVLVRVGSMLAVFAAGIDGNGDLTYYDELKDQMAPRLADVLVRDGATPDS